MRLPPFNPYIALVIGVIAMSTSAIFVKLATDAPAAIIANYQLFFGVIIMTPIILKKHRHEFKLVQKKDWLLTAVAGILLASHFILWFESLNYTSVASSVVLVALQPIFIFLGTYLLFKERFSSGAVISMFIALFGSIIISWSDFQMGGTAFSGDILALLGTMAITGSLLFGQKTKRRLSLMTYTFIVYSMSVVTLIIYNLVRQNPFVGYPLNYWWIFLALAIFPMFFGHTLFNWALRWLNSSKISMGIVFEPIIATILAYIVLGERVTSSQWLGGTIILIGLFLFVVSTSRKRKVTISPRTD